MGDFKTNGFTRVITTPEYSDFMQRLIAAKESLSKETLEALDYRARKGYKPVDIQEKFIDVHDEDEFNKYKRALSGISTDPNVRNKIISQLGYRPVLRYKRQEVVEEPTTVKKLVPRKKYNLSFTTMPDKNIELSSEEEFNNAKLINDIDSHLANVYKGRFNNLNLDRNNAYNAYRSANPSDYSKMFLSEADRNAAIAEYAKQKRLDPSAIVDFYVKNRSKYYPRELVSGTGAKEQQGNTAASTLYGYRNYLTTMVPIVAETQEEIVEPSIRKTTIEKDVTYPFRFGYKGTSPERPVVPSSPKAPPLTGGCVGDICEKAADIYSSKNKYLFKKKNGGRLVRSGFIKLFDY